MNGKDVKEIVNGNGEMILLMERRERGAKCCKRKKFILCLGFAGSCRVPVSGVVRRVISIVYRFVWSYMEHVKCL